MEKNGVIVAFLVCFLYAVLLGFSILRCFLIFKIVWGNVFDKKNLKMKLKTMPFEKSSHIEQDILVLDVWTFESISYTWHSSMCLIVSCHLAGGKLAPGESLFLIIVQSTSLTQLWKWNEFNSNTWAISNCLKFKSNNYILNGITPLQSTAVWELPTFRMPLSIYTTLFQNELCPLSFVLQC